MELRAFLAFSLLALNIGFVGVREKLIAGNRTGKAFASFPSLVSLWQEENFTLGTHPIILTSSWICITNTSTGQWSFFHVTLDKRDLVSNNMGAEILVFKPFFSRPCFHHRKPKLLRSRCLYYSNSYAARKW